MMTGQGLQHVYQIEIEASPQAIWNALTSGELTKNYWFDSIVESDWKPGSRITYTANGELAIDGVIEQIEPPALLVYSFKDHFYPPAANDPPSRVTWTIAPGDEPGRTRVTLVHDGFGGTTETFNAVRRGWPQILAGLQTLLELGKPLRTDWGTEEETRAQMMREISVRGRGHVYETYIASTPEAVWEALTSSAMTSQYFHELVSVERWEAGAPIAYRNKEGKITIEGTLLEVDPPRRLSYTFKNRWNPQAENEPASRVTWEITPTGDSCRVVLVHDEFADGSTTYDDVRGGWVDIVCGLKRVLEKTAS